MEQVLEYKNNLFELHVEGLAEKLARNSSVFSLIRTAVYFHNETEDTVRSFVGQEGRGDLKHFDLLGRDSLTPEKIRSLLRDRRLDRDSQFFTDEMYGNCLRYLRPSWHALENTEPIIFRNKQRELIESKAVQQKIKGVAGSGKTLVLAKRAVNAHLRTGSEVLILTFNLTLKNYITDQINRFRENTPKTAYHINNYHRLFKSTCNNLNLVQRVEDYDDENFFERVKDRIPKYEVILIDEIQDFEVAWQRVIRKYFLAPKGEFVLFGDEKQNIYVVSSRLAK